MAVAWTAPDVGQTAELTYLGPNCSRSCFKKAAWPLPTQQMGTGPGRVGIAWGPCNLSASLSSQGKWAPWGPQLCGRRWGDTCWNSRLEITVKTGMAWTAGSHLAAPRGRILGRRGQPVPSHPPQLRRPEAAIRSIRTRRERPGPENPAFPQLKTLFKDPKNTPAPCGRQETFPEWHFTAGKGAAAGGSSETPLTPHVSRARQQGVL